MAPRHRSVSRCYQPQEPGSAQVDAHALHPALDYQCRSFHLSLSFFHTVGLVASIVQLTDFSYRVIRRIDDLRGQLGDVPKAFAPVRRELEYVEGLIQSLDTAAVDRSDMKDPVYALIEGFKKQLQELEDFIRCVRINEHQSLIANLGSAMTSVRKDDDLDRLIKT